MAMDGTATKREIKRRLMTGLTVSVAAHLIFVVLLGSAPKPAGSSGAPRIAVAVTMASGDAAAAKPWAIPDPPTPDLPVRKREPRPEPKQETKPVEVAMPVEPRVTREETVQRVERPPVIEKKVVEKKVVEKKPPPKAVPPPRKPVAKPPRQKKPVKRVTRKRVEKKAAKPPARTPRKARKTAPKRQAAAAPKTAKTFSKSPVQSARRIEGEGKGGRGGADIPVVTTVRFASRPTPARYPPLSLEREEEGVVVVRALVNADGFAGRVLVWKSSGYPRLDQAARKAVGKWHFKPARRGGRAIRAWVQIPVAFRIR